MDNTFDRVDFLLKYDAVQKFLRSQFPIEPKPQIIKNYTRRINELLGDETFTPEQLKRIEAVFNFGVRMGIKESEGNAKDFLMLYGEKIIDGKLVKLDHMPELTLDEDGY